MRNRIKKYLVLILIIVFGSYLRFTGISPGYPRHTDEGGYSSALTMIWNKNLDPGRYDYPSGVPLIHYSLFKFVFIPIGWVNYFTQNLDKLLDGFIKLPLTPDDYKRILTLDIWGNREINVLYWGRYITAAFGVGVIFLIYLVARNLFGGWVGIVSAVLVSVNYRQVLNSHIGLPDIYNAFFLILAIYFAIRVLERGDIKDYFWGAVASALYFSVKFQVFAFLPFMYSYVVGFLKRRREFRNLFVFLLTFILVVVLLNPYLLIKFETFLAVQKYQLLKYGAGSSSFYLYPYWYLYHFGIGKILSMLSVIGVVAALGKYSIKSFILLLPIIQSLYTFTFFSRGGFYTRNFVAVTPLILIFAAFVLVRISKKIFLPTWASTVFLILILTAVSWDNIQKSFGVVKEYQKPWNEIALSSWEKANLPPKAKISAHGDTPLAAQEVIRLPFDFDESFSVSEFMQDGADFAISNSSWSTNAFYWWISSDSKDFWDHYWQKPVGILEYSYPAFALRELEDFSIAKFEKEWVAPDTFFVVSKIPKYTVLGREKKISYDFQKSTQDFIKEGRFWLSSDNLSQSGEGLVIEQKPSILPSVRWESGVIDISGWSGIELLYEIKSESNFENIKTGYLVINFYESFEDAAFSQNRVGVRLSARNIADGEWKKEDLVSGISRSAKFAKIGFASYDPQRSVSVLRKIDLYESEIKDGLDGFNVGQFRIDQNNLFPNSHGNL